MSEPTAARRPHGLPVKDRMAAASGAAQAPGGLPAVGAGRRGDLDVKCSSCADPIAPARLRAAPEAIRCLPCQRAFEAAAD
jgi:hypothetical protein